MYLSPTPKVEWLKVFGPLPVGRHETTEGGVLEITDLEEADAAVDGYRCVVRDSTGNVEADAYFSLVIEGTEIGRLIQIIRGLPSFLIRLFSEF